MKSREVPEIYTRDRMAGARLRWYLILGIAVTGLVLIGCLADNPPAWPGTVLALMGGGAVERIGYWGGRLAEHDARLAAVWPPRISPWTDGS